jgi:hypothetical protein
MRDCPMNDHTSWNTQHILSITSTSSGNANQKSGETNIENKLVLTT